MSQQNNYNNKTPFLLGKPISTIDLQSMPDEQIQSYIEYAELAVEYANSLNNEALCDTLNFWVNFKITALSELERRYLLS